ncbi:hypothetical protein K474DRAFT_1564924, partial [Panus rudis PR-1116 ss-1]
YRCMQCHAVVDKRLARQHTGGHILKAMRGVDEGITGTPPTSLPCGFCGRAGIEECTIYLTKKANPQAVSNCRLSTTFYYKKSLESTRSSPCTNTPIICRVPGCCAVVGNKQTAIWKYNMEQHIRQSHQGYAAIPGVEEGVQVPIDMWRDMFITRNEEQKMGIPEEKIP